MIPRLQKREFLSYLPVASWSRGQPYARSGRVSAIVLSAERLRAEVQGTRNSPYDVVVHLRADGHLAHADCSCPVGRGGRCKHVAAVLVAWADELAPVTNEGPDGADHPPLPTSLEALLMWAEDQGVETWLDRSALLLQGPRTRAYRFALQGNSLADVLLGETVLGSQDRVLRDAAWSLLQHRAACVQHQLATEVVDLGRRSKGPERAVLGPLWERLMLARDALREHTAPDGVDADPHTLVLDEDSECLVYTEARPPDCSRRSRSCVTVDLSSDGPLVPRCECRAPGPACPLRLRAIDTILDHVVDPRAVSPVRDVLAGLMEAPRWERDLVALRAALVRPQGTDEAGRLGWELLGDPERPPWSLRARLLLPYKRKPGWRRLALGRMVADRERLFEESADWRLAALSVADLSLSSAWCFAALPLLVGHPRVLFADHPMPIRVVQAALRVAWRRTPDGGVQAHVELDGVDLAEDQLLALLRHREGVSSVLWTPETDALQLLEASPAAWRVIETLARRGQTFPAESVPDLLQTRHDWSRVVPLALDPALRGREVPSQVQPQVRAELLPGPALNLRLRLVPDLGAGILVPGQGILERYGEVDGERVFAERDPDAELALAGEIAAGLGLEPGGDWTWDVADAEQALACVEALQTLPSLDVRWARTTAVVHALDEHAQVALKIEDRPGWFALGGDVAAAGVRVPLSDVMEAVLDGRRFVRAEGHTWVRLTRPFREQLASLARVVRTHGQEHEVPLGAAPLIDALEAQGATVDATLGFQLPLARLREAAGLALPVPSMLQASLRPYQDAGYRWLARVSHWSTGACLADDMGLGKTVQALALLLHRRAAGPVLIVAPTSVGFNWLAEAARFAPELDCVSYRGGKRQALLGADLGPGRVLITSYDLMTRDADALSQVAWGTVVLDEAQAIKNPRTRRARAAVGLQAGFVLALSGTPVENRVEELWSLYRVLVPGLLGSAKAFRERFARPLQGSDPAPVQAALAGLVRPFMLRRRKDQVALDLPPRTEIVVPVDLSARERALYERVRRAALQELDADHPDATWHIRALAALTRLRQLACHPRLVLADSTVPSSKLERTLALLEQLQAEGHRALVFSQFTSHLALLREVLDARAVPYRYLDGSLSQRQRQREVEAFQKGEGAHFLISLKAGGTGLNLTAATYVLHLDPWWNPAVEDQATNRAHRIGQDQPVTVYRLVARETVEDGILALHATKRSLAEALVSGTDSAGVMSPTEILGLMQGVQVAD